MLTLLLLQIDPAGGATALGPLVTLLGTLGPTGALIAAFVFMWQRVVRPELDRRGDDRAAAAAQTAALQSIALQLANLQPQQEAQIRALTTLVNEQRELVSEVRQLKECTQ